MRLLPWLVKPPVDFNERCKRLHEATDPVAEITLLANSEVSLNQSHRLARVVTGTASLKGELQSKLDVFKLGLVSNGTVDLLTPMLLVSALRHGIALEIVSADFDQAMQQAVDPESAINLARPDAILIALDYRAFPFGSRAWGKSPEGMGADDGVGLLQQIRDGFRKHCGAVCLVQSLATPPNTLLGNLDSQIEGLVSSEISRFNRDLVQTLSSSGDVLIDIAQLANQVGTTSWFDERQWLTARIQMANEYVPLYCDHVARVIAAMRGKSRKCLVLDLDNTLWGGVIGDDGIDGITVGQGNPLGESYLALQKYALELKSLGVILAVCSKNNEDVARSAFRDHAEMLLREEDFAAFHANWEDKASNLREISRSLNIGLEALVFVDDNPAERDIVRTFLPQVAVPELPTDPALVTRTVAAAGYFEMTSFNQEDRLRSQQYAANTKRQRAAEQTSDINEFLRSLEMKMGISAFDKAGRKRITQLINKTNQFNLTTRRYTEAEVESFETSADFLTMQVRLADRFGDNGMISVVICKKQGDVWEIDTWLMSCRVIKRRVEEMICDELVRQAQAMNVRTIRGIYIPSGRNQLVADHFQKLGFTSVDSDSSASVWELDVSSYSERNPPITIDTAMSAGRRAE